MRVLKTVLIVVLCLAAAGAAFSAGYATRLVIGERTPSLTAPKVVANAGSQGDPAQDEAGSFKVFWESWHLLEQNFNGTLPGLNKLAYSAVRGVLADLGDPHTIFVEPRARQLEKDEHRGRFGGIGAWVYQREDDRAIVLTPQEDGPAFRAGVRDGDVVLQVDQAKVDPATMTREDVIALIRGEVGSKVRLVLRRAGEAGDLTFDITREEFETPSVEWRMLDDRAPNVGYIHITLFTERTSQELTKALQELKGKGAQRLVLDLRDNPGGLLTTAIEVASQFVSDGVVMYEQKRDGTEQTYPIQKGGLATDLPLTVLVNGGTASASEIVAGALRDHDRAKIVGEKSYGKGSVQLVFDLSDGSSIHITVARWLTPARHEINGVGIQPDTQVGISDEDRTQGRDPQLEAAIAQLVAQKK